MKGANKIGIGLIIVGCICMMIALWVYLRNYSEEQQAKVQSALVVEALGGYLQEEQEEQEEGLEPIFSLTEVEIDGVVYIGILEIPSLGIQLPIQKELTEEGLKISPCRYEGSMMENNMIIGAHNYTTHLGPIRNLQVQDTLYITDLNGQVYQYELEQLEILEGTQLQALISGNTGLTLFTCNYDNTERVVARFIEIK